MNEDTNWLLGEKEEVTPQKKDYEELPSVKFTMGKIATIQIDFTTKFTRWTGTQSGKEITKAIIPCTEKGEKKLWWLNVKNPIYHDIINRGINGQRIFKIHPTGSQADTRYNIIEEE